MDDSSSTRTAKTFVDARASARITMLFRNRRAQHRWPPKRATAANTAVAAQIATEIDRTISRGAILRGPSCRAKRFCGGDSWRDDGSPYKFARASEKEGTTAVAAGSGHNATAFSTPIPEKSPPKLSATCPPGRSAISPGLVQPQQEGPLASQHPLKSADDVIRSCRAARSSSPAWPREKQGIRWLAAGESLAGSRRSP